MAENLTVPADFEIPRLKGVDMNLLPPSAFETNTRPTGPWIEIAKATEEVAQLKAKLKEAESKSPQPPSYIAPAVQEPVHRPPPPEICKYSSKKEDFKYIDELISKQACEISELKNEVRSLKCQQREEITNMERQLTVKEREYTHQVTSLEMEMKVAEHRYETQVDRLSREHERETDGLTSAMDERDEELELLKTRSSERITDLETTYKHFKRNSEQQVENLVHELKSTEIVVQNQVKQIGQLKKYMGESDNLPKPADIARKERDCMLVKLKTYESERENMNSTIQLLNIRLNSLNEILGLQELEMSKVSREAGKNKNESLLLTRWREKVYALMVQQKSADITCKKDENNWKAKVVDLEQRLSTANNQIEQLSHTLSDKDAQLNMEANTCNRLQTALSEAQQLALCLDDRVQENVQHAQLLQEFAASVWLKYQENLNILNAAMSSLKAYSQRVSFASGRLEMLQGLFARREAILKLQIEKGDIPEKDMGQNIVETDKSDSEECPHLRCELEKVTRERDNLADQIKQDSQTWDAKILSIRVQVEDELETLKQTKSDLESIVQDKSQKCCELSEKLETCQNDLDFATESIEDLKMSLGKQELNVEHILEEQRREMENQLSDRLSDMDRQTNDAKREQAKAVVSLRQLERQMAREKERFTEQLSTTEEHYKRQTDLLQAQLTAMEKERNLMMATLRQEGLVGKLKSERREPITHSWDRAEEPVPDHVEPASSQVPTYSQTEINLVTEEPMETVLEDLKSLTDAVLKEDNSESDSDNEV